MRAAAAAAAAAVATAIAGVEKVLVAWRDLVAQKSSLLFGDTMVPNIE